MATFRKLLIQQKQNKLRRLRLNMDGIIIGINTLINDSPRLTGRLGGTHGGFIVPVIINYAQTLGRADYVGEDYLATHKQPTPVVLDSKLRCPLDASLLKSAATKQGKPPIIFTGVHQSDGKYSARWVSGEVHAPSRKCCDKDKKAINKTSDSYVSYSIN